MVSFKKQEAATSPVSFPLFTGAGPLSPFLPCPFFLSVASLCLSPAPTPAQQSLGLFSTAKCVIIYHAAVVIYHATHSASGPGLSVGHTLLSTSRHVSSVFSAPLRSLRMAIFLLHLHCISHPLVPTTEQGSIKCSFEFGIALCQSELFRCK